MKRLTISFATAVALFFFVCSFSLAKTARNYLWPVKAKVEVTSVFCDKRNGHPHGGIDISLFGKVGTIPIVSVDQGKLMRIRDSKYGYGKALYIRMPEKMVAVYAHLDSFSPRIQKIADSLRKKTGLEKLDYYYEEWEMDVEIKKGELIAYGGNTGTSTAHLHFEMRYDDLVNVNPLTNGFPINDTVAPVVKSLLITPIDNQAKINGKNVAKELRFSTSGKLLTNLTKPLEVTGRVGISVDAYDRNRVKGRAYAPYAIDIKADGKPFFQTKYETWGYIDQEIWAVQYDYLPGNQKRYLKAYNPYPSEVPFFSEVDNGTFNHLQPGDHEIQVIVSDGLGNEKAVSFPIMTIASADPDFRPWPVGHGDYVLENGKTETFGMEGDFALIGKDLSFFEPIRVTMEKQAPAEPFKKCYQVLDSDVHVRQPFYVQFKVPDQSKGWGVYYVDGANTQFIGNESGAVEGMVRGATRKFGTYCIAKDLESPKVLSKKVSTQSKRFLRFRLDDALSGMNRDAVQVHLDGKLAIVDFNSRSGRASARYYWPVKSGKHEYVITAIDRIGNMTELKGDFVRP